MNTVGISLSGMQAAQHRLANSANNVANMHSVSSSAGEVKAQAYQPTNLLQSSIDPAGGVRTSLQTRDPATIPVHAPSSAGADENGMVDVPNVDPANEAVEQMVAGYDFQANLKAFAITDSIMQSILNIKV